MKTQDLQGRLFQPGFIADVPTGNLVWVDPVHGNDDLAARHRLTVPFKTLPKARDAAKSGDTIMVLPGTYNANDLLRNGVNWHFFNGAKVAYSESNTLAIFDTNGTTATSVVTGHGEFSNAASAGSKQVVNFADGASSLSICARRLLSSGNCIKAPAASGTLVLDVSEDIDGTSEPIWITGGCEVRVRAYLIRSSTASAVRMSAGRAEIDAYYIRSYSSVTQDGTIRMDGGSGMTSVRAFEIFGQNRPGVLYNASSSSTKIHIHGARILSLGTSSNGRAVHIATGVSDGVRMDSCVLVASGDKSLFASSPSTRVHVLNGLAVNIAVQNVSAIGGTISQNSNIN